MGKIISNFFYNYDTQIIFLLAGVNIVVLIVARFILKTGYSLIYPSGNKRFEIGVNKKCSKEEVEKIQKNKNNLLKCYSFYANFTAIFPLLGILGTVASLITISGEKDMMDNLMVALVTTLWGVFWAIVFKIFDSSISCPIEAFVDDADYVIRNYGEKKEEIVDEK